VDISYINLSGTFYYLCSVLDGYSRFIVHWEIRASMTTAQVEVILQRAREKFPGVTRLWRARHNSEDF
jgi:transposase InsO family protein